MVANPAASVKLRLGIMVRRSFRLGLRLGLLVGVVVAVAKVVQSRRSPREEAWAPSSSGASWPPLQPEPVVVEPPAATVTERIPPVRRAGVDPQPPAPTTAASPLASPVAAPPPTRAEADQPGPTRPGSAPPTRADGAELVADRFHGARDAGTEPPPTASVPVPPMAPAPPVADPVAPTPVPPPDAPRDASAGTEDGERATTADASTPAGPVKKAAKKAAARKAAPPDGSPAKVSAAAPTPVRTRVRKSRRQRWVESEGKDAPASHPVKAKLSSMLYHLPGMAFYERTHPDRCYADADAAEADGFTRAKR